MLKTRPVQDDFKNAVLHCISDLYRYAVSICHDTVNAEDLVSETVLRALERRIKLKDETKLKQWMLRVLTNIFIDQKRKMKRMNNVSLDARESDRKSFSLYEAISQSHFTDHNTPEITLIQKLSSEQIQKTIKELPDTFRIAFVLCDIQELSYQEIASILDVKVGTVRSRISRARSMLQKSLWQQAKETGIKVKGSRMKSKNNCDC